MKRLILIISVFMLFAACKKDDSKPKAILLNEISTDGTVTTRIYYSADNKPSKYEAYNAGVMNAYLSFEYDASGHIAKLASYLMPGNIPGVKILFQCDGQGKVTTNTNYDLTGPTPNIPSSITTRTYNAQGVLIKGVIKDYNGNLINQENYLYFPDGNLKEQQIFKEASNQLWMSGKSVFSIPNGFYPKGVEQLQAILGNEFMASLFSESIHEYTYDQNGAIVTHRSRIMSGREFNDDGSVKKQVQTYTSIKPPQPEVVTNLGYSYLVQ
jgi:YD repeat-containing protein